MHVQFIGLLLFLGKFNIFLGQNWVHEHKMRFDNKTNFKKNIIMINRLVARRTIPLKEFITKQILVLEVFKGLHLRWKFRHATWATRKKNTNTQKWKRTQPSDKNIPSPISPTKQTQTNVRNQVCTSLQFDCYLRLSITLQQQIEKLHK